MRVLVAISGIDPRSGGPTRSVKGLCRELSKQGVDVSLLVLIGRHEFENPCGVKVIYGEGISSSNFNSLLQLSTYNLVHIQGMWEWPVHKVAAACRKAKVPYVISPRGMLDPWALSYKPWKKRIARVLYQNRDLRNAAAFHVTAELEKEHVRALGYTQTCIVAPNGVEVPESLPAMKVKGEGEQRIAIFLSRLHPGKGLLTLAEAWALVKPQDWIMKVVGPDSYGHKAEVLAKLDALGIPYTDGNIRSSTSNFNLSPWEFHAPMNDDEKWSAYRSADLLIHPSVSENFGITIAEGLYAGLPVIATQGTPWKELVDYKCGWWIEQGVGALSVALKEAMNMTDDERHAMGAHGQALIKEGYSAPSIGAKITAGYRVILKHLKGQL